MRFGIEMGQLDGSGIINQIHTAEISFEVEIRRERKTAKMRKQQRVLYKRHKKI